MLIFHIRLYGSKHYLLSPDKFIDSPFAYNCPVSFKMHTRRHTLAFYLLLRCPLISSPRHLSLTFSNP
ncbi:unnamed protein product [Hymenolepis diminuta]|uniref:Uncharacterized protein n=1 Tax=Hymenolepis diminuta TaxID=6216 RepID=A0A564ZG26_HYMDI|nr:unnamed protein product [Hymenolepis diminuta]